GTLVLEPRFALVQMQTHSTKLVVEQLYLNGLPNQRIAHPQRSCEQSRLHLVVDSATIQGVQFSLFTGVLGEDDEVRSHTLPHILQIIAPTIEQAVHIDDNEIRIVVHPTT